VYLEEEDPCLEGEVNIMSLNTIVGPIVVSEEEIAALSAKVRELEAALADALEKVARQKDRFENLKEWTESHTPRGEQACLFNLFDENNEH